MRGTRRGRFLVARSVAELNIARDSAALSHAELASALGWSQSAVRRHLKNELDDPGVVALCEIASVLGYEVSLGLHPIGDALRDKGQLEVGKRFDAILSDKWRATDETLLPGAGEQRAWDKLLRLVGASPRYLVGVDIETRVHDIQALVRRTRGRQRDGMVDAILIVLADTAHNRRVVAELRQALGPDYAVSARKILGALRSGERLVGGGVVLV
jgi:transcriptional regulator with XRE-family HTH domain